MDTNYKETNKTKQEYKEVVRPKNKTKKTKIIIASVLIILLVYLIVYTPTSQNNSELINTADTKENTKTDDIKTTTAVTSQTTKTQSTNNCGNGICDAGETIDNCQNDCLSNCGNNICESEQGETYINCGYCPEYVVDPEHQITSCGNGVCEPENHEETRNCPSDCQ